MKAPGPGMLEFFRGVRAQGFLDYVGELWREYGDVFVVSIGPRKLMFTMHPDAVEYVSVSHRKNYDKARSYETTRQFLTGQGLVSSRGALWRRQRRLLAPFFTPKGIQAYSDAMISEALSTVERWEAFARDDAEVEVGEEMSLLTAAIILKALFSSETIESIESIKGAVETMVSFVTARLTGFPIPLWIPTASNRRFIAARKLVCDSIASLIAERRGMDEAEWPEDLLTRLMLARDEETGEAMSETLLRDETITAFVAGHETTARTLTFAWYVLATHPEVADKLHEELDRALGDSPPTVKMLEQLPYTMGVVKETLRMYPPAPFYVRDAIADDEIGGFEVPAGTPVMVSPFYTHRHPDFWKDPETFDPERWTGDEKADSHGHAYFPFAAGPRICIGNNFALLESHILLAILAQRFIPRLRQGYQARWEMQGVLGLADELPMIIASREIEPPSPMRKPA